MASLALWAVRILRRLPHTKRFDAHLTDCAALAVLYAPFDPGIEPLRLAHVFEMHPLPDCIPRMIERGGQCVHSAVHTDRPNGGDMAGIVFNPVHLTQSKTLH